MTASPSRSVRRAWAQGAKLYESHAFLRFLLVGGVNTLFGYGVFCLALWASGWSSLALIAATVLGTLFNFMTTGTVVFRNARRHLLGRFIAVYALVFACNAVGLWLLERAAFAPILAQAILTPLLVILSFLLNRNFVFHDA